MSKRNSRADKANSRLKKLEHKLRKLKSKVAILHAKSKKLSGKVVNVEQGAKLFGKRAGDAGLLIAVKSREFANTAAALQTRMVELEAGLHKLEEQTKQPASPEGSAPEIDPESAERLTILEADMENLARTRMVELEAGLHKLEEQTKQAASPEGSSPEIDPESAERLTILEADVENLARKISGVEEGREGLLPRVLASEDSVQKMAAKVDRQERWMESAQGNQEAVNAQIQRLSRSHDQLQGDYESLDGMSTDQLASLMSRLDTLESADQNVETKLAEFAQKIGQIPSDQLASLMSKIASLEAGDQTVAAKLAELEQKTGQIPSDQLASVMSKIASLEADDQTVAAKLAGVEQKISAIATDPSTSLMSKIDSLEADDHAVEAKLSEFEQKTNDIETLVQALEAGLATQERTVESFKGELEKLSNLAAQNREHTLRLEGQAQDHAATLTALKTDVSRQTALHEELAAVKGGISRGSEELDKKVKELGKANDALKFDALKQSTNLDKLSSRLNVRSWALGALSFLAIGTVLLAFLHTQGEIASNRDVFYAELAAVELTPGSQGQSGATGKAVIQELQRLNASMAKLARLESKPWPRDPEFKLVQRDMAELTDEISSLKTRMDEAQARRTAYRTDFPRVAVVSAADLGTPSLAGGDSREYTIQLIGSFRKSSIAGFVRENELARDAALFELQHQGKPWFVLLYGKYTSFEQASNTLNSLPGELTRHKAWIRYLPRSL